MPRPEFAQGDNGTWTVNTLADPGDDTCDGSECTLREALGSAAAGDRIQFASGLQGDVDLASQLQVIRRVTIDGAGRITLDAQQSASLTVSVAAGSTKPLGKGK